MTKLQKLLSVAELDQSMVNALLDTAEGFYKIANEPSTKLSTLKGKTLVNLFYESSTRTRTSFELAGKRLSADVVNITPSGSSVSKGESLADTAMTIDAMNADVLVVRHGSSGAAEYIQKQVRARVINAGDGLHEHPTQALLDAFTIRKQKKTLTGLTITICGDILHSRVARSNIMLHNMLGNRVRIVGPKTLLPSEAPYDVETYFDLKTAVKDADVVMALRIQSERMGTGNLASLREYSKTYGINESVLAWAKPDVILMHPGPMNRGVEVSSSIADGPQSHVLNQVSAGVAVRMAVLHHLFS